MRTEPMKTFELPAKRSEQDKVTLISEEGDVEFLRKMVSKLWGIIDDIDTYSDVAKSDCNFYRRLVERRHSDRWRLPIYCDGYHLYRSSEDKDNGNR